MTRYLLLLPLAWICTAAVAWAQDAPAATRVSSAEAAAVRSLTVTTAEYLIGPEDVLDISVWKNPELSRKVPVRPDGKVSLPLVNDIQAAHNASVASLGVTFGYSDVPIADLNPTRIISHFDELTVELVQETLAASHRAPFPVTA